MEAYVSILICSGQNRFLLCPQTIEIVQSDEVESSVGDNSFEFDIDSAFKEKTTVDVFWLPTVKASLSHGLKCTLMKYIENACKHPVKLKGVCYNGLCSLPIGTSYIYTIFYCDEVDEGNFTFEGGQWLSREALLLCGQPAVGHDPPPFVLGQELLDLLRPPAALSAAMSQSSPSGRRQSPSPLPPVPAVALLPEAAFAECHFELCVTTATTAASAAADQLLSPTQLLVKAAGFGELEQKYLYNQFMKACAPSASMCFPIFAQYFAARGYCYEKSKHLFRAFDSHRRGYLLFRDFLVGQAAMEPSTPHGSTPAEMRCRYIFRYYDQDCDGCLSFVEFKHIIRDIRLVKKLSATDAEVTEDALEQAKVFSQETKELLPLNDFLSAVGQLRFRGTSNLFRLATSVLAPFRSNGSSSDHSPPKRTKPSQSPTSGSSTGEGPASPLSQQPQPLPAGPYPMPPGYPPFQAYPMPPPVPCYCCTQVPFQPQPQQQALPCAATSVNGNINGSCGLGGGIGWQPHQAFVMDASAAAEQLQAPPQTRPQPQSPVSSQQHQPPPPPPQPLLQGTMMMQLPAPNNGGGPGGYTFSEQYHYQQQQLDAARPEASFEGRPAADALGSQQQQQQQQQYFGKQHHHQQQQHLGWTPPQLTPRRRNGYMHNILYKTELCRDVQEKGACPRGKTCQFAHSPAELHDPRKHPLYKTAFCYDYKNRGYCPRGQHCFHVHDVSELKAPPAFVTPIGSSAAAAATTTTARVAAAGASASGGPSRAARSGRLRRRQQPQQQPQLQQHQQSPQPHDEAPGTSASGSGALRSPKEAATPKPTPTPAASETPFNYLMKKLQAQEPTKPTDQVRAIEEKTKALGLDDVWALEPARGAQ